MKTYEGSTLPSIIEHNSSSLFQDSNTLDMMSMRKHIYRLMLRKRVYSFSDKKLNISLHRHRVTRNIQKRAIRVTLFHITEELHDARVNSWSWRIDYDEIISHEPFISYRSFREKLFCFSCMKFALLSHSIYFCIMICIVNCWLHDVNSNKFSSDSKRIERKSDRSASTVEINEWSSFCSYHCRSSSE